MAYVAITCLMNTIQQSMEVTQYNFESYYKKLVSLRAIMEKPSDITGDVETLKRLEAEIVELVCSTEDIVDSESRNVKNLISQIMSFWKLHFLLKQVVGRIDSRVKKWMEMQNMYTKSKDVEEAHNLSTSQHSVEPRSMMVGYRQEFEMIKEKLARRGRELEVFSIVGMGGLGKTTLANKIYNDSFIMSRFDIRAKATVTQEHCVRNVLLSLICCISGKTDESHECREDDGQLADRLQKLLKGGRRYLLVIDDIWTTKAWDDIKLCFPDCNNGSRILMTTRNVEVAEYASSGNPPLQMRLMNFDESWRLLYEKVFEKGCFSAEYEKIGKQIALKCGGLPLALTVIAGLLSKIGKTLNEWESVAINVSSAVSTDVGVQCMRVLALSYHHLPHHLKSCFLYFAIFPEDELIFVDKLVELWVVEGFLKVEETKSVEEVAEKCLKELIDRSLISIRYLRFDGKIESCVMHDMTRELCLREARNMNFVNVIQRKNDQNPFAQSIQSSSKSRGRITIPFDPVFYHLIAENMARCCNTRSIFLFGKQRDLMPELLHFKLVRVLDLALMKCWFFPNEILDLIHLRYLSLSIYPDKKHQHLRQGIPSSIDIPSSISGLCYLQTFILNFSFSIDGECPLILPSEILALPRLRYLYLGWNYLLYRESTEKRLVLKNLQRLSGWNPRYCTSSVFRLFPNLKKLQIHGVREDFDSLLFCDLRCLDQLEELEICVNDFVNRYVTCFLECITPSGVILENPPSSQTKMLKLMENPPLLPPNVFPQNIKTLALFRTSLKWKDLNVLGKLPKLESLKLVHNACKGEEWEVVDEGFPSLKFLVLNYLDIQYWRASCDQFPCLEQLFLELCFALDSIPQDFADITTLDLIDIRRCAKSVGNSAKQIQQVVQDNYASSVKVHIR